jgi:glucosamine-6-phosphate deaminase
MEVIVVKDYQELSKVAAEIIIEEVKKNPNAILGLATGGTPLGTYENIINAYSDNNFEDVFYQFHNIHLN